MPEQHGSDFDCRICGEHFYSRQELDRHSRDVHSQQASGIGGSVRSSGDGSDKSRGGNGGIDEA